MWNVICWLEKTISEFLLIKASYTWSQKSARIPQIWLKFDSKPTILIQIREAGAVFCLHVYEP